MNTSRRNFIKTAGSLTIGFCLGGELLPLDATSAYPGNLPPVQDLPQDLRDNPRINAWLEVLADGRVRVLTGKIELGQGIGTAVLQVAAEELNMEMTQVEVLLAETGRTPDEGYTAGSNSIEASAMSIRYAAAAAREHLLTLAAQKMNVPPTTLTLTKGKITGPAGTLSFADILEGRQITDEVHAPVALKPKEKYQLVGKPIPRQDTARIINGQPVYVQDLQLPGMAYGCIVRPPAYGAVLKTIDEQAVRAKVPDLLKIVVNGSFLGVIATGEWAAIRAQQILREHSTWSDGPSLPQLTPGQLPAYIKALPVQTEKVGGKGNITETTFSHKASYFKPYIMHGSIGPSCAVALYDNDHLDIWSHSQGIYPLRETIAGMLHFPAEKIHIKGVPGSGCYGHNGADDVAADAALLAMAYPGKPIHVQWTREDEHAWEPYGSAMVMDIEALLDPTGKITHWKYALWSDTHGARPGGNPENLLPARYLEKPFTKRPSGYSGGAHRNAEPYYTIPNQLTAAHSFIGPLRTSSLRSLGAYANIFAIESFMDELAIAAGKDPFEFRLMHLDDERAKDVLRRLREHIHHSAHPTAHATDPHSATAHQLSGPHSLATPHPSSGTTEAIGIAFSRYKNSSSYCAVAAHVTVDRKNKNVRVKKMWAVIDAGEVINLDGIKNQTEGGMIQSASWTLMEQVQFNERQVTSRQWNRYPVLRINEAPAVEVIVIDRPHEPALGAGEAAQGPAAAAITNAASRALGRRMRQLPLNSPTS